MDKKVLLFCITILTGCWLIIHVYGAKTDSLLTAQSPAAPVQTVQAQKIIVLPSSTVSQSTESPAVNLSANAAVAANTSTNDADSEGALLQSRLAAHRAEMSRWREWAARDFKGALAAISAMPAGTERDQAVEAICFGQIQSNPALTVEMAQSLQQPDNVVQDLVQQWAGNDSAAAFLWASSQPAGAQRDELMRRVTYVLSQAEPEQAARLVIEQMPPGSAQDEALMTVVHQWGEKNLSAAASWVKTFPVGPLQARATQELEGMVQRQQQLTTR